MNDSISWYLRVHGPQTLAQLQLRFGLTDRADPEFPHDKMLAFLDATGEDLGLVVPTVDNRLTHVIHLFDGLVLTQRATAETSGRRDLWTTASLQPLVDLVKEAPLALDDGGRLELSPGYGNVLLGPEGWLPPASAGDLLAFRLDHGVVIVTVVQRDALRDDHASLRQLRGVLASHIADTHGRESLPLIDVTQTLAMARLEAPELLNEPTLPLQEVLHEPVDERSPDIWRDLMAWRQNETISFYFAGMPEALHSELEHRASRYGMSFDQFVIAILGHLAWRTPFAEDMGPWEAWDPDRWPQQRHLRAAELPDGA